MKKLMRKAVTVLGSLALIGATIGGAAATTYPAPFNSGGYAVVYGSGSLDSAAASTVAAGLPEISGTVSGGESISDDEIALGGALTTAKLGSGTITDSKIGSLMDQQIS
ncbi:MAG: RES family NAD+ phosphorylase, partial [Nanoarchaeota archaeon]|nr:RES family NAD+ phosphorylase [Nanoarchaeota archaeon]